MGGNFFEENNRDGSSSKSSVFLYLLTQVSTATSDRGKTDGVGNREIAFPKVPPPGFTVDMMLSTTILKHAILNITKSNANKYQCGLAKR